MRSPADTPLADYAARLDRHYVAHYLAPEFHIAATRDAVERMRFAALLDRLTRTLPETWFLSGPAGTGKTSLINALAAELPSRSVACLRVTSELLRHIPASADPVLNSCRLDPVSYLARF